MTGYMQDAARAMKENEELRKEIGRLRDALRFIANGDYSHMGFGITSRHIAKEALK